METSNSNISEKKKDIHEGDRMLAALVDERIRPGLAGTSLAARSLVLYLIASYLRSPSLPHLSTVFPYDRQNCQQKVSLLADGRTAIAVDLKNQIIEYDIQTGTPMYQFTNQQSVIHLHANTCYLIGYTRHLLHKEVNIWDRITGYVRTLRIDNENVIAVDIFPDQHPLVSMAVIVTMETVYIWEWKTDTMHSTLVPITEKIIEAIFSSDLQYVTLQRRIKTQNTTKLDVWQISPSWSLLSVISIGGTNGVALRAMSAEQQLLAVIDGTHSTVRLWDYVRMKSKFSTSGHSGILWDCAFSTEGRFLVVGESTRLTVWNVDTGDILLQFPEFMITMERCTFMANDCILLVYPDRCGSQGCRVRDVSCLHYNDPETMHYTFFRSLVELYIHTFFRTLQ